MPTIKVVLESTESSLGAIFNLIIPALAALIGVLVGGFFNHRINVKNLKSKQNEIEINEIKVALTEFYYPILLLIKKNKQLSDIFKFQKPNDFRTLTSLLDGKIFSGNDGEILKTIIELDESINSLILQHKGKVKNNELADLLAKASAHFDVIIMAYDNKINGECERFEGFVYPRELQIKIECEIDHLKNKLNELEKQ